MKISEDKKTIYLDVPLGSTLYCYDTRCCDVCMNHKDELNKKGVKYYCCGYAPCHTVKNGITEIKLGLSNLAYIMDNFEKTIFKTKDEAEKAMDENVEKNRAILREAGFAIDEDGKLIESL